MKTKEGKGKMATRITRRKLLEGTALIAATAAAGAVATACGQATPQVIKETVVVEKPVEKVVKETVVVKEEVQKEVTKVVEKVVEPTKVKGITNDLGVEFPADALPLDKQYNLQGVGQTGGGYGHIMESLYNRAFEHFGGSIPLTTLDHDMNVVPVGCESWKQSDDGLSWDFKLRKELVFSDGKPVTAQDWVYTLQRSMANGYDFGWFYSDILNANEVLAKKVPAEQLGIEAVDDYTLRIKTTAVTPYLPAVGVWFAVAAKHAYEQYGENWALDPKKYVSSGPFILAEFERGIKHKWVTNKTYKGPRKPYFIEIREETLPSGLPAYIAGQLQGYSISAMTPAGEVGIINANPILRAESHPQPSSYTDYIGFNTLKGKFPPLDDPNVRLALCKAIDKETLIAEIYRGFANPGWGLLPKGFPNYIGDELKTLDPNVCDVKAAQELLSKAGFPGGKGFPKFELWMRQPSTDQTALAQAVQARWKENLGIQIELHPADFQSFTDTSFKQKIAPMYYVGYALDYYDPATFMNVWRTAAGRHPHLDPEWDEFYNKANSTLDPAKRFQLMAEAEKMLVKSTAYLYLAHPFSIALWPCNLSGEGMKPNKYGYQFSGGGGVGCAHWYEMMYWSNSDCRAGLK